MKPKLIDYLRSNKSHILLFRIIHKKIEMTPIIKSKMKDRTSIINLVFFNSHTQNHSIAIKRLGNMMDVINPIP